METSSTTKWLSMPSLHSSNKRIKTCCLYVSMYVSSCIYQLLHIFSRTCEMVFALTQEKASRRGFTLKPRKIPYAFLKTVLGMFKIVLRLRQRHVFMSQSLGILNIFNTLNLNKFSESLKLFSKNVTFPYRTVLSKANFRTN